MKNMIMAMFATLTLSATSAYAGEVAFIGSTEYAIESADFSVEAGTEVTAGAFTFTGLAQFDNKVDWDFTGVELGVSTSVTRNVSLYTKLQLDGSANYDEMVVGTAFRF